jgi:hypothetical protein
MCFVVVPNRNRPWWDDPYSRTPNGEATQLTNNIQIVHSMLRRRPINIQIQQPVGCTPPHGRPTRGIWHGRFTNCTSLGIDEACQGFFLMMEQRVTLPG